MKKGDPQLTSWTGRFGTTLSAGRPYAAARRPASGSVGPNLGGCCVIQAKASAAPAHSSSTSVGPMFSPNVKVPVPGVITPSSARANIDPMTG